MIVYRLSKGAFKRDLSGRGAEKAGGRWNSKGTAMLYTSQSRALCLAEVLVHLPLELLPIDYHLVSVQLPKQASVGEIAFDALPADWKSIPHIHATQQLGDRFVQEGRHLVLQVPSAVVQREYNFLLNPYHPDFRQVQVLETEPFVFDDRFFVR